MYTMFITNNHGSFHLWWKENLVKHQKVSKYCGQDCTSTVQPFVAECLRKECGDLNERTSDNNDEKDDDDDANSKDVEVAKISTGEALTMLDRLVNLR